MLAERKEHDIAADHDDIAMGEVQHLGNAVDHRIAQRDECVYAAERNTSYKIRQKLHTLSLCPEINRNPSGTN